MSGTRWEARLSDNSPIGARVAGEIDRKRLRSARYRDAEERLRPFEQVARVVIMRRAQLGLSQEELARRIGTTASAVSRIESGQHRTSIETLRRLAEALGGHAFLGFEFGTTSHPNREMIPL